MVKRFPKSRSVLDDNPGRKQNAPLVFDILASTRKKLADNEKDRVFALYGLFTELHIPFPRPDYKLSVEDVYRQATAASIRYDKALHVLYHAPSDKQRESLASWVPDWAEKGFEPSDGRYGVLRDRFAASGPAHPIFRFSSDESALILRGKIIDTIIYKAEPLPEFVSIASKVVAGDSPLDLRITHMQNDHGTARILRSWVEISTWSEHPTGESSKEALRRTLVMDIKDATVNTRFDTWYEKIRSTDTESAANAIDRLHLREQPSGPAQPGPPSVALFGENPFHSFITLLNSFKCMFFTKNSYFGTAPDPLPVSVQAGDVIALVSGLEMPVVVRPVEGGYRLITHVYLHGVMGGELWPEREDELEDLVLL